ncbi:hypothetical protein JZ751_022268 [Albula glossodonta]|uniref:RING-type domain-containing protein n=1 Tax=Albula glossodonta TaxID=121402 RepID=A0A8T2NH66_9TELE|nr:hypothetical protein JZ751_022268 [Albula glossodonta]
MRQLQRPERSIQKDLDAAMALAQLAGAAQSRPLSPVFRRRTTGLASPGPRLFVSNGKACHVPRPGRQPAAVSTDFITGALASDAHYYSAGSSSLLTLDRRRGAGPAFSTAHTRSPHRTMSRSPDVKDDPMECPLCMEPLEIDDINFFPCTCGYQICRFCWHRIRTDENGLCPACRKHHTALHPTAEPNGTPDTTRTTPCSEHSSFSNFLATNPREIVEPPFSQPYPEDPAVYKPLSQEELQRIKNEKKQKQNERKQKMTENRKHLASVRVVQRNLVFVVGLSQRLADPEVRNHLTQLLQARNGLYS